MRLEEIDWQSLERLRTAFLEGSAGQQDYWQSEKDLASYDQTFAQRIGWKWDYVLAELRRRGWSPPQGNLLDWGCGSGVAGRAFIDHFGPESVTGLLLWDRSGMAVEFAKRRVNERFPGFPVRAGLGMDESTGTLLLSHVLTELNDAHLDELLGTAAKATAVLWVEPGTHEASRRLIQIRERLRTAFHVVAPCTHEGVCGMVEPQNEPHWCHHFASPPPGVFADGQWTRFAALAGIDLRSLPLSFLVLDQRPLAQAAAGAARIIGRPRVYKAHAQLMACDVRGLHEGHLNKRTLPGAFRQLKKGATESLQVLEFDGDQIIAARTALPGNESESGS